MLVTCRNVLVVFPHRIHRFVVNYLLNVIVDMAGNRFQVLLQPLFLEEKGFFDRDSDQPTEKKDRGDHMTCLITTTFRCLSGLLRLVFVTWRGISALRWSCEIASHGVASDSG
jgi:hypothetical protein